MPDEKINQNQRDQFAVAMALGQRVSVWAKKNEVPRRTCYDWRKTQEYKVTVRDIRRRTIDRAVGFGGHHTQLLTPGPGLDSVRSWPDWHVLSHLACHTTSPSGETAVSKRFLR